LLFVVILLIFVYFVLNNSSRFADFNFEQNIIPFHLIFLLHKLCESETWLVFYHMIFLSS